MILFLIILIFIGLILFRVPFFTLSERKVIRYIQYRIGPNKVGFIGIIQPFSDGLKLFSKEIIIPSRSNILIFLIPIFNLIITILIWITIPFFSLYIFN